MFQVLSVNDFYIFAQPQKNIMKTSIIILSIATLFFASCGKKDGPNTNPPAVVDSFININAGSIWTYHEDDSSTSTPKSTDYSITSTSRDSAIGSRSYHVYSYSYGGSQYLNLSGNDYYQFASVPGSSGTNVERKYLVDNINVGASWSETFSITVSNIPVPVTLTNTIVEKGISRTVNSVNYTNVIHVSTSLSSSAIPSTALTSSIDSYYAPNYGLIENSTLVALNYSGFTQNANIKTKLMSAALK